MALPTKALSQLFGQGYDRISVADINGESVVVSFQIPEHHVINGEENSTLNAFSGTDTVYVQIHQHITPVPTATIDTYLNSLKGEGNITVTHYAKDTDGAAKEIGTSVLNKVKFVLNSKRDSSFAITYVDGTQNISQHGVTLQPMYAAPVAVN
jgi:hypothetical protein